jgi:hypothetical protein
VTVARSLPFWSAAIRAALRGVEPATARVRDEVAHDRDRRGRGLALEQALHEPNLAGRVGELAAEAELELVVAVDQIGDREQIVGERRVGEALGAQAELLDARDELVDVRPARLDGGGEHGARVSGEPAEEPCHDLLLRLSARRGVAECRGKRGALGDPIRDLQQFAAGRRVDSRPQRGARLGQCFA